MTSSGKRVIKVILCGEYGVGKSSLFRRFCYDSFVDTRDKRATLGFDNFDKRFTVDGKEVILQLWDTGGLERVASMTTNYYKFAEAAILVFGYDGQESFNMLSQHMLEILTNADNAKIFLCGNKMDLEERGLGPSEELIRAFQSEYQVSNVENMIQRVFKVSCKTGAGVHEMFLDVATMVARMAHPSAAERDVDRVQLGRSHLHAANFYERQQQSGCCSSSPSKTSPAK